LKINNLYHRTSFFAGGIIALYSLLMLIWLFHGPNEQLVENIPGMDKSTDSSTNEIASNETVNIGEKFQKFIDFNSDLTGKWPRFRGADYSNIIKTNLQINENWEAKPPRVLWSVELGEGHAAPAIYDGMVYILDYMENEQSDALRCFSLKDGKEIWRRFYKVDIKRNHGMSRTIPAVNENYILTVGPRGHAMCVERKTGNLLWGIDMEKKYSTEIPFWYTGQCPLIENDTAILASGGKSLMMAVDCKTGKIVWETPNPDAWKMSHSSIIPITIENKKMYVYCAIGGIAGISAEGADAGKILWKTQEWAPSVVAPSPLYLGNGKILLEAGYGAGAVLLGITKSANSFNLSILEKHLPAEGISSEQQTPIFDNNLIYCIQPKDAATVKNQFVCYSPDNLKTPLFTSGKSERFGLGPYLKINDNFLILNDEGTLTLAKVSSKSYKKLSQFKFLDGQDAWGPLAFADGFLILRDSKKMMCIDLK